jgi:hypothetical protein
MGSPFSSKLPHWHDVRKMTFRMLTLLNNLNSVTVSWLQAQRLTHMGAMVMEE